MKRSEVDQFASDKILSAEHIGRVARWAEGENVAPIIVELDMTNRCNHLCPGCVGGRTGVQELPHPIETIKQLSDMGVKAVTFTGGGEPLMHSGTPEAMRYAKRLEMDVGLITNGSIMTPELADTIIADATWCRVSLDSSGSEMYQETHGLPAAGYEKTIRNIEMLVEAKQRRKEGVGWHEDRELCTLGIGYLTSEKTLTGMFQATKTAYRLGVDYIQFRPFHFDKTDIDGEMKACRSFESPNFRVLCSQHKYDHMHNGDVERPYGACHGQQFAAVIQADGKMTVCCHTRGDEQFVIGDTTNQTVREIWDSEQRRKVVDRIDVTKCVPLCRGDTFNRILWNIKQPRVHVNFL